MVTSGGHVLGCLALLLGGITWGTTGLFVRALDARGWHPLDIAAVRTTCSLIILSAGVALIRPRLLSVRRSDLRYFLLSGISGPGTSQPMFILAVAGAPLAVAVLLNYTAPLFVALLARLFLKEKLSPPKVIALGLSIVGLGLVTGVLPRGTLTACSVTPLALLTGLGSGFFYAVNLLVLRRLSGTYSPATVQVWGPLLGLPVLLVMRSLLNSLVTPIVGVTSRALAGTPVTGATAGAILLMSLGPGLVAFLLVTYGLARVEAAPASILLTVEPLVATLLGWLVLGEHLTFAQGAGMAVVLGAICLVSLERKAGELPRAGEQSPHAPG
ncbi:MAG: EamA family transporter [Bacillota bacterium]|nr:EamA family transporter [Bacillota bacterium]